MIPTIYLALMALICVGAFLVGLRFARMSASPFADVNIKRVNRFGQLMMVAGPLMFTLQAALVLSGLLTLK